MVFSAFSPLQALIPRQQLLDACKLEISPSSYDIQMLTNISWKVALWDRMAPKTIDGFLRITGTLHVVLFVMLYSMMCVPWCVVYVVFFLNIWERKKSASVVGLMKDWMPAVRMRWTKAAPHHKMISFLPWYPGWASRNEHWCPEWGWLTQVLLQSF